MHPLWFEEHQNGSWGSSVWQFDKTPTGNLNHLLCCETCRYHCLENLLDGSVVVVVVVVVVVLVVVVVVVTAAKAVVL
jgi:hypothetical protein